MPATVLVQRLHPLASTGSVTIVKDHVPRVPPAFPAARPYRNSNLPATGAGGWWHTQISVPVWRGQVRPVFRLVTVLPFTAALRSWFTVATTTAALCAVLMGGPAPLGGLAKAVVSDNETSIEASRRGAPGDPGRRSRCFWSTRAARRALRPQFARGSAFIQRGIAYYETSFLPLREFESLVDMQGQANTWSVQVGDGRHVRRLAAHLRTRCARREWLRPLPAVWPDVASAWRCALAATGSCGSGTSTTTCRRGCHGAVSASKPH